MDHQQNHLFPIFLKLENFRVLIVGGGSVGLEKLNTIIENAPRTIVRVVSPSIGPELRLLAAHSANVTLVERRFRLSDLDNTDLLITAIGDHDVSRSICAAAKERQILINAADKPELCDFYLGSIVQKGDLKIGISTNGKSPTMAKRLKEWLSFILPEELDDAIRALHRIRNDLRGDMKSKVTKLNHLTRDFTP